MEERRRVPKPKPRAVPNVYRTNIAVSEEWQKLR
jgi:hypothetical protein